MSNFKIIGFYIEFIFILVYNIFRKEGLHLTDEEQKRIFAKNLNQYISLNNKQQIEVAKDLRINPTTLNMWCKGNSIPGPGKIRALADYFGIGITDLTDEPLISTDLDEEYSSVAMKIGVNDDRFKKIVISYSKMPNAKKELLCDFFENFVFNSESQD